jgi:WD40 repeat protein
MATSARLLDKLTYLVLIAGLLAALSGCAETPPTPEPVATAAQMTASPQPTATPSRTSTPAPTATPQPPTPTPALSEIDLGVTGGDCYGVQAMVADPDGGTLYVLCERADQGPGRTLVAVDSASGERLGAAPAASNFSRYAEPLLAVGPEAQRFYSIYDELNALVVLDTSTLEEVGRLPGVEWVEPARGAGRFYVLTAEGLAAYRASDLQELATLPARKVQRGQPSVVIDSDMVYNPANDRLYIENGDARPFSEHEPGILVLNGEDLALETTLPISQVLSLAVDAQANRVYAFVSGREILSIGEDHTVTGQTVEFTDERMRVDHTLVHEGTNQVHVVGTGDRDVNFWLVLDGESLQTVQHVRGLPDWEAVAPGPEGQLLTVRKAGDVVVGYDPATGQPTGRLVLGRRLLDAGADPGSGRVYVLDSAGGLTVLDGAELQVIETRPDLLGADHPGLMGHEAALGVDPGSGRLFVADEFSGETVALELETLEEVGRLDVAGPMAVDPAGGRLFVGDEHLYVYDTVSLEPVGDEPALRLEGTPDGMYPAPQLGDVVFDQGSGRLFIRLNTCCVKSSWDIVSYTEFDPDSLEGLGYMRVEVGTVAHSPVVFQRDHRVWLSYDGTFRHGLGAYADDHVQLGLIKGLSGQLLADAERLYLLRERDLLVLDPARGYVLGALPLGEETWGGILDDAGERFYLWGWDRLASISTPGLLDSVSRPQPGLVPEDAGNMIVPSPNFEEDGTLFAVIPDTLEYRFVDTLERWWPFTGIYRSKDGGETWQLTSWGIQNYSVEDLAFDKEYETNHTLFAVAGALFRSEDDGETWQLSSRPGLAFVSDRTGDKEIYTMHYSDVFAPFGTEPQRLTDNPADDDNPAWSPDGQRLVFQSDREGNQDLWIMNWDGSGLVRLTSNPADDLMPAWSPDGGRIAFTSLRDGNSEIYVMPVPDPGELGDEASVVRLTDHPADDVRPAWSPTGRRIAFYSTRHGDSELFLMSVPLGRESGDRDLVQLTKDGNRDLVPDWLEPYYNVHVRSDLTGNADLYHTFDTGPSIRRLTEDPANETAPSWLPNLPGPVRLPAPTPTPTPGPPVPTPSPVPTLPPPPPSAFISLQNADRVTKWSCWQVEGADAVAYSPDGRLLAVGADGQHHLYDAQTLTYFGSGKADGLVHSLAFSPDGRLMAAGGGPTVNLWDISDCIDESEACGRVVHRLKGHPGDVVTVDISPDGGLVATATEDEGTVWLWRVSDGSLLRTLGARSNHIDMVAFSPSGDILATLSSSEGANLRRVGGCLSGSEPCGSLTGVLRGIVRADEMVYSPDGQTLAMMDSTRTTLWQAGGCASGAVECGDLLRTLEPPDWAATSAFNPDWTVIASGGGRNDGKVWLWAVEDGRVLNTLTEHTDLVDSLAFNPRHPSLASLSGTTVCVWSRRRE